MKTLCENRTVMTKVESAFQALPTPYRNVDICPPHLRREDLGVGQEVLAEHFDDEVELSQVLPLLCDFQPHQVVVRELPGGRRLLGALRHQADVLLLVEHVHQHLRTSEGKR